MNCKKQGRTFRKGRWAGARSRAGIALVILCLILGSGECSFGAAQSSPLLPVDGDCITPASDPGTTTGTAPASAWTIPLQQAVSEGHFAKGTAGRLTTLYENNSWSPYFVDSSFDITADGQYFLERLTSLTTEGFDPARFPLAALYDQLNKLRVLRSQNPTIRAAAPPQVRYAMQSEEITTIPGGAPADPTDTELGQLYRAGSRVDATMLAALLRWTHDMDPFEPFEGPETLHRYSSLAVYLDSLKPQTPQYTSLEQALGRYLALASTVPPLPRFGDGDSIRLGATGTEIEHLQKHLALEDFYTGPINGRFDAATEHAVKVFQQHHLLLPDGVVGQRTKAWLNVSFADKAKLIAESMQGMRQSQSRKYTRYLRINVPEYILEYYKDGKLFERHKIVVGRSSGKRVRSGSLWVGENHTPSLTSTIQRIVINPRWYVPERIRLEIDDKIEEDPEYLAEHGFVPLHSEYSFGEPRIYQQPGPGNPLGKVKFEFPNRYGVYLHDTSEKNLFQRTRRDFSHGCIRVDQAVPLAELLLRDDHNPAASKIEGYLAGEAQRFIELLTPVPIIIEYNAVSVSADDRPLFCGDPYGRVIDNGGRGFPL